MRLISIKAFLGREKAMCTGGQVNRQTKVLEFRGDESSKYAMLHWWIDPMEIDYKEMVDLIKMNKQDQDEIRDRLGYKILDTC